MMKLIIKNRAARKLRKTGEQLFINAMQYICENERYADDDVHSLLLTDLDLAAKKGHKESRWILDILKMDQNNEIDFDESKKRFIETNCPAGWFWAGIMQRKTDVNFIGDELTNYIKQSSDGGYGWGRGLYLFILLFGGGGDEEEGMVLAAETKEDHYKNNPFATEIIAAWHDDYGRTTEAFEYYLYSASLGWESSMCKVGWMMRKSETAADFSHGIYWAARGYNHSDFEFPYLLEEIIAKKPTFSNDDLNHIAFTIGFGMYWYIDGSENWTGEDAYNDKERYLNVFPLKCLDYYCNVIDLQQQSIFLFLHFWKRKTGVKEIGKMIGQMVWAEKHVHMPIQFEDVGLDGKICVKKLKSI